MSHKFRVAICGGGVGGLTCAVALSQCDDIQVDVYEAAAEFAEIGAGIGIWPRAWKVLSALGLAEDLANVAVPPPDGQLKTAFHFRKSDQPQGVSFHTLLTPGGMLAFHRADFHRVLVQRLSPRCGAFTRKRLVSYTHASSSCQPAITLHFQDGTTAKCDVLIGADGVKSPTRRKMVHDLAILATSEGRSEDAQGLLDAASPKWSGTLAYRTTIPAEKLRTLLPHHRVLHSPMLQYFGKNSQITVYPIAGGTLINFAAMRARYDREYTTFDEPWVEELAGDQIIGEFDNWEPEVRALLKSIKCVSRWAVHTTLPLPSFVSENVALLGDAAHAMMPYQGAGAGQAIEDAYILSSLLANQRTTLSTLDRALHAYDAVRRPAAAHVQDVSRENGLLYTLNYPGLTFDGPAPADDPRLEDIQTRIRENWEWAWQTTADADLRRALQMLDGPVTEGR